VSLDPGTPPGRPSGSRRHRGSSTRQGSRDDRHYRAKRRRARHLRRRWLRRTVVGIGGLIIILAIVGVIGALHAIRLEHRLQTLSASLLVAQNDAENGKLAQAQGELAAAQVNLTSVNSSLYDSPDFTVLNLVPIARQNLQAVRSAVGLGLQLVGGGQQILNAGAPLESPGGHLDVSIKDGQVPLSAVQDIQSAVSSVVSGLPTASAPPHGTFVLKQVRNAEDRVWAELDRRRAELTSVNQGLTMLNAIAGGNGDSRYLIAVANTAEMRGAGGMILSYGVLTSSHGKVTLGNFGPIDDLTLQHPVSVGFPADFTKTFGALQPTLFWRNATIMSDFTVDAPVLEAMYTQATGLPVNGVFQVDPAGLAAVLAGTGPITVPDLGTVDATNVVALTLNQAYVAFPNRPIRQEYLTTVARSAFAQLTNGSLPSLRPLGTAVVKAAQERHIILSFTDPNTQDTVKGLGFDGSLPGPGTDFAQLTVQNFGGDKMDYYLNSAMAVTRKPGSSSRHISVDVDLTNTAPAGGKPPYIFGPGTDAHDPPGVYRGLATVYLPPSSSLTGYTTDSTATVPLPGTQNNNTAITFAVDIPPGGHGHVTLGIDLPPDPPKTPGFVLVPSPRVNPTSLTVKMS
jgi:cell division protein FtsB